MKIQLHSYSNKSVNSIVSINSRMMKEGESLAPGLKLEKITPDGVIFSYKGYRFQHGIW
jgi:general secretion pathway protein B